MLIMVSDTNKVTVMKFSHIKIVIFTANRYYEQFRTLKVNIIKCAVIMLSA